MSSAGPTICSAGSDDASAGDAAWTNPSNITADDSTNATCVLLLAQTSHLLTATWAGSAFAAIPDSAQIAGYAIDIRRRNLAGTMEDFAVTLDVGNGAAPADGPAYAVWASSYETHREGGVEDIFGVSDISGATLKASTPTVTFRCKADTAGTAAVDWIKLTVFYAGAVGGSGIASGIASGLSRGLV